ncbi:hypothetical protein D9M68_875990 [compost metagenome]
MLALTSPEPLLERMVTLGYTVEPTRLEPSGVSAPSVRPVAQGAFRKKALDDDWVPEVPTRRSTTSGEPASVLASRPASLSPALPPTSEAYF